jgi:hypothetical protein
LGPDRAHYTDHAKAFCTKIRTAEYAHGASEHQSKDLAAFERA